MTRDELKEYVAKQFGDKLTLLDHSWALGVPYSCLESQFDAADAHLLSIADAGCLDGIRPSRDLLGPKSGTSKKQ